MAWWRVVEAAGRAGLKVLLVEDNPDDATLFAGAFSGVSGSAFVVTHVASLAAAREVIERSPPDVIVLDLGLPDSNGLDTLAQVLQVTQSIPVAIMTGQDDEDNALRAVRAGAQDYLVKGVADRRTVGRVLRHAIERHRLVNELEEARRREAVRATHDALTGIANRHLFFDRLDQLVARSFRYRESFALAFLDLDDFKGVNDAHGHEHGDRVLQEFAHRLRSHTRSSDTVARLGGDEFGVLMARIDSRPEAECLAAALVARLVLPMVVGPARRSQRVSFGVAVCPEDGSDPSELLKVADRAMYRMKRAVRENGIG